MRPEVRETFNWQAQYIPRIRAIVGAYLLQPATLEQDQREATDLIVLEALKGPRIACRVRTPKYATGWYRDAQTGVKRYFKNEVTITCERETGALCEWDKMILGGMADWFFYGIAVASKHPRQVGSIKPLTIIDLRVSRDWIRENHGPKTGPNKDSVGRRCWFYPVYIDDMVKALGPAALIARKCL